jgi:primosomal protein N' (replication factor Y)
VQGVIIGGENKWQRRAQSLVDPAAVVTPQQIALARRMAHESLAPLSACISLMLPPGVGQQADTLYTLSAGSGKAPSQEITEAQRRLLKLLEKRGPLRGQQIERSLSRMNWRPAARALERLRLLTAQPPASLKCIEDGAHRAVGPPEQALAACPTGKGRVSNAERRQICY